jgi:N utilization substance protein B
MARVDRNILRLAVAEMMYLPDIPGRVTINEAVELAKRFGAAESPAFINGLLDTAIKTLQIRK